MRRFLLAAVATSALALATGPTLAKGPIGSADGGRSLADSLVRLHIHQVTHMELRRPSDRDHALPRRRSEPSQFWPLLGPKPSVHDRRFRPGMPFQRHRFAPSRFHHPHQFHPHGHGFGHRWWEGNRR